MMKKEDVKIGQVWKRKDGRKVKLVDKRPFRGLTEFKLEPIDGGRSSWKWSGGIVNDLSFVE